MNKDDENTYEVDIFCKDGHVETVKCAGYAATFIYGTGDGQKIRFMKSCNQKKEDKDEIEINNPLL